MMSRHTIAATTTIIAAIAIIALLLAQLTLIANNKYKQMYSEELKQCNIRRLNSIILYIASTFTINEL